MEPYAAPDERKIGTNRPQIPHHAPDAAERVTRKDRQAAKDAVIAERRAIKKSARRTLKRQMMSEFDDLE